MSTVHCHKKSFTLVELLVVIAIGVMLTLLAIPAFRGMMRANAVDDCAATLKNALERARVRAVSEHCYVAVILPNGAVSEALKPYRLGGSRLAYVDKNVSGEYTFSRWLDPTWRSAPRGALLSRVDTAAFVPQDGGITGCTVKITDALAGAPGVLAPVSGIKGDDGAALDAGANCAFVFTPQGGVSGSGKCWLLISEGSAANGDTIVYPTANVAGSNSSADNVVLKMNKLTGTVEYDK